MMTVDVPRRLDLGPARALLLIWAIEALAVTMLASRLLSPILMMTGAMHADDIPQGDWFLLHPPLVRERDIVHLEVGVPFTRWLQQSSNPSYCCWRRFRPRPAYPGYDTAEECNRALADLQKRNRAPLALRTVSESPDVALSAARCIHKTDLWKPASVKSVARAAEP